MTSSWPNHRSGSGSSDASFLALFNPLICPNGQSVYYLIYFSIHLKHVQKSAISYDWRAAKIRPIKLRILKIIQHKLKKSGIDIVMEDACGLFNGNELSPNMTEVHHPAQDRPRRCGVLVCVGTRCSGPAFYFVCVHWDVPALPAKWCSWQLSHHGDAHLGPPA